MIYGADQGISGKLVLTYFREVFGLNAADDDGGAGDLLGDVGGMGDADGGVGIDFALSGEEGADADVVGAGLVGLERLVEVVGGDADDPAILLAGVLECEIVLTEVKPVGFYLLGEREVVVDDELGLGAECDGA